MQPRMGVRGGEGRDGRAGQNGDTSCQKRGSFHIAARSQMVRGSCHAARIAPIAMEKRIR